MNTTRAIDVALLSDLRKRLGDSIVNALLAKGVLTSAPLTHATRATAEELLRIEVPTSRASVPPPIARLKPADLLSDGFDALSSMFEDEEPKAAGRLDNALLTLARRAYPAYLASIDPSRNERSWDVVRLRQLDAHRLAVDAMKLEPGLATLFEADQIESSFSETEIWVNLHDPIEQLLYGAWHLALLRGEATLSSLFAALIEQLERLRALCAGEAVAVPTFLGFGDMQIDRPVEDGALRVRPYMPSTHDTLLDPSDRLGRQGGGFVVESSFPSTFRALRGGEALCGARERPRALAEVGVPDFRHWADCLAVSVALSKTGGHLEANELAAPPEVGSRPQLRWILNADPLGGAGSLHFSQGWRQKALLPTEFGPTVLGRAEGLFKLQNPTVRVGIARLSAALEYGRRWLDCFLDAVIAWEALSGDCLGAVTKKMSSVLAHLVAAPRQRKQMQEVVRGLYAKRSRVVHGGNATVTAEDRAVAILVGLTALKALVDDYPHLLEVSRRFEALRPDPKTRDSKRPP